MVLRNDTSRDQDRSWVGDLVLAGTVLVLAAFLPYAISFSYPTSPAETQLLVAIAMIAPLALRSHYPQLMLLLSAVASLGHLFAAVGPMPCLVVVPLIVYSVARRVDARSARAAVVVGLAGAVIGPVHWFLHRTWQVNFLVVVILLCASMVLTPYVVGRRLRETESAALAAEQLEHERVRTLLAEQEQRARMAEVNARQQIARELHDIVAHSLSVMVVQAEGGRALAAKKPERAAEVLQTIAGTGRDALVEMRRIVDVLRNSVEDDSAYAPMPGLADIPEMVQRTGDRVRLSSTGKAPACSAATQLTIYRIVQEGLTNFLKHAGSAATALVRLDLGPERIVVEVVDDGVGVRRTGDGLGNGLKGMHERVTAMGGTLETRHRPEGGFRVYAVVPVMSTGGHRVAAYVPSELDGGQSAKGLP